MKGAVLLAVAALAALAGARAARPRVAEAWTEDPDGTGSVARVAVRFDQPVRKASCRVASFGLTASLVVASVGWPDASEGEELAEVAFLELVETGRRDTSLRPLLAVDDMDGGGLPVNAAGEELDTGDDDEPVQVEDRAAPVLYAVMAVPGSDVMRLRFTEPVVRGGGGAFTAADLKVAAMRGGDKVELGVAEVSDADGSDGEIAVRLDEPVRLEDIEAADQAPQNFCLEIPAAVVADARGNEAGGLARGVENVPGPYLRSAETRDSSEDGRIDEVRLEFSEPMSDVSFDGALGDVEVAGYTVKSFRTGAVTDDNVVFVTLEQGAAPDTAATPGVRVRYGRLRDAEGREVPDSGVVTPADGAAPCLIDALGAEKNDTATLVFSEPVGPAAAGDFGDDGPAAAAPGDFVYHDSRGSAAAEEEDDGDADGDASDTAGGLASRVVEVLPGAGDAAREVMGKYAGFAVRVRLDAPLAHGDLEGTSTLPDRVSAAAGRLRDAAGRVASGSVEAMLRRDPDAPLPEAPTPARDNDDDGHDDPDGAADDPHGVGGGGDSAARDSSGGSGAVAAGLGAGIAVLGVVVVCLVLAIRRRRSKEAADVGANVDEAMDRWDENRDGVLDRREVQVMLGSATRREDGDTGASGYARGGFVPADESDVNDETDVEELP